jgi:ABC-type transport system substrate-binding protein
MTGTTDNFGPRGHAKGTAGTAVSRRLFLTAAAAGLSGLALPRRGFAQTTAIDPATIPGPTWAGGVKGGRGINLWLDGSVNFDPLLAFGRADYYNLSNFFRGLTFLSTGSEPQLDLAQSVDISADGLTYTFTLREGVLFHNARVATAEDFRWSIERAVSPAQASWVQGFMASVAGHADFVAGTAPTLAGLTAPDDRTVVITLAAPDARLLAILGIPPFAVLPKEEVEGLGEGFREAPVGTGPYRLQSFDGANSTIVAERFADYIYRDHLPYLDEIEIRWNVPADLQFLQVSRNDADLSMTVPSSVVPEITANPELSARFSAENSFDVEWWSLNVTKAPFDDVRVRQAINHAIDRSRLAVFGINPTGHIYPPSLLGFSDTAPIYAHDPDRAKALLAEAGVSGLQMKTGVLDSASADNVRMAQLMAQDLEAVGITATIEQRQETGYDLGASLRDEYDMWNMGWGMGLPDPSELVSNLFGTGGAANFNGYSNPALDAEGAAAVGITDRTARGAAYAAIEAKLLADAPFLFIGTGLLNSFRSARLQNFVFDPAIWTYWDRYWLADA